MLKMKDFGIDTDCTIVKTWDFNLEQSAGF